MLGQGRRRIDGTDDAQARECGNRRKPRIRGDESQLIGDARHNEQCAGELDGVEAAQGARRYVPIAMAKGNRGRHQTRCDLPDLDIATCARAVERD